MKKINYYNINYDSYILLGDICENYFVSFYNNDNVY